MEIEIKIISTGNIIRFETLKSLNFDYINMYKSKKKRLFFFTFNFENGEDKEDIEKFNNYSEPKKNLINIFLLTSKQIIKGLTLTWRNYVNVRVNVNLICP